MTRRILRAAVLGLVAGVAAGLGLGFGWAGAIRLVFGL